MKRLAVLGYPVGHSRSPAMQNAALADLGLADEFTYEAIEVAPDKFAGFLGAMAAEGFAGANVTVPHKQAALALADEASAAAREIGAANTLTLSGGRILADNTDAPGLLDALPESPAGQQVLLLGAGGAARAALWALTGAGAHVELWNRTESRAEALAAELGGRQVGEAEVEAGDYSLIVNCSAAGLGNSDGLASLPLGPSSFRPGQVVVDMVYGDAETTLLAAARLAGAATIDGLEMLVRQGGRSLEIWTGRRPPIEVMRSAVHLP